jgi:hypothetical protein
VGDSGGDTCVWYDINIGSCGGYDTDDFIAASLCCVCGGGTIFDDTLVYCDTAKEIIKTRLSCYSAAEQEDVSGFCDTKVLTQFDEPTASEFFECYESIKIDTDDPSLCDNIFPLDNLEVGGSFRLL